MRPYEEQPFAERNDQKAKVGAENTPIVATVDLEQADELDEDDEDDEDEPDA